MADAAKPIPVPNEDSQTYWEGCRAGRLLVQRCLACAKARFYPRILCPACGSTQTEWFETSGDAEVFSYTVVHRAPSPAFKDEVPYVLAIVELPEGVRMMTNIVDCDPASVRIGMKVRVRFDSVSETISIPKFAPKPA